MAGSESFNEPFSALLQPTAFFSTASKKSPQLPMTSFLLIDGPHARGALTAYCSHALSVRRNYLNQLMNCEKERLGDILAMVASQLGP